MVYPDDFFMYDEIIGDEIEVIEKIEYPKPIPYAILYAAFNDDDKKELIKKEQRAILIKNLEDKKKYNWTGQSST
jgi:hypothetical protein